MKKILFFTVIMTTIVGAFTLFMPIGVDNGDLVLGAHTVLALGDSEDGGCCGGGGGSDSPTGDGGGSIPPPPTPTCQISINKSVVEYGETYTLSWKGTPSGALFYINGQRVAPEDSANYTFDSENYERFVMKGDNGGPTCEAEVRVERKVIEKAPSCDTFTATPNTLPYGGGNVTLAWTTSNTDTVSINNGVGVVAEDGSKVVSVTNTITYILTASKAGFDSVTCPVTITVKPHNPAPSCDTFTAIPDTLPFGGGTSLLSWTTSNADTVSINNGIGIVAADDSLPVSVTNTITYILTVSKAGFNDATCPVTITVKPHNPAPSCDTFTATPNTLPYGGGNVTLAWTTSNTDTVSINNGVGVVAADGSKVVSVTNTITYILTASKAGFDSVTCPVTITVGTPNALTCADNVTFTASDYSLPRGGGNVILSWTTTGVDSISIAGVASTNLSDSEVVSVTSDRTYTLVATAGSESVSCPLSINVDTGGGGGGSSNPRCELEISDDKISRGQEITLTWDTSRVSEVLLEDDNDNILLESDDSDDFDGEMTIKPTEDTTYTLTAKRGSRERTCDVDVEVTNDITVLQSRTQLPLVAGISLTQVPYTGFEAGPTLTALFYIILTIWGLFVAYIFVIRRDSIGGVSLAGAHTHVSFSDASVEADSLKESSVAEGYVHSAVAEAVPANLPTAAPVVGYASMVTDVTNEETDESIEMTELENRAHAHKVLLSSDAMRFFMNATEHGDARTAALDTLMVEAKASFPSDEGWVALNLARMESLMRDDEAGAEVVTQTDAINGGSLAEAIVTGNIVAAYQMIAHRPMIALADAAADLDAVYRLRKGETVSVSDLLVASTEAVTDAQIEAAIAALTGALDGTYPDEASAVKMAIMKAVKAVA